MKIAQPNQPVRRIAAKDAAAPAEQRRCARTAMRATALLVIDIQRGAFDGLRCPPIDSPTALVGNAEVLVAAARDGGHPVVFIQHCDEPGQPFERGSEHWLLHESLVPAAGDIVLQKYQSSSFEGTGLDVQLRAKNVSEVVLCGLQSEYCVSNTAFSALLLGYTVWIAQDGHGTWPSGERSAGRIRTEVNSQLSEAGATLATTESLASALCRKRT